MMTTETILHQRSIATLAAPAGADGSFPIQHVHSLGPARILIPKLPTGGHFFDLWPVRELPEQGMWAATHYDSFAPPLFVLHDVTVHSSAGILAIGDHVIGESLANTAPQTHAYRALVRGIAIQPQCVQYLPGVHVSVLSGGERDYRHALLDGLARLSAVPDSYLAAAASLLVPAGGTAHADMLGLFDLLPSVAVREVEQEETLRVETLVFPLSVCGESAYHPCVADFYGRLSANVPPSATRMPRRIYIDDRGSCLRPLAREADLIAALIPMGFVPVRLDMLSLPDQIRLFRQAEAIVAPHGSALTNLGFARPGCLVVELLMDAYVDWSYRNLAALMHLRYDCVLGRARTPWQDLSVNFHRTPWQISVQHVVAAVAHSLHPVVAAQAA
jgi:capsular polysaccharide biosynthesis protein